MSDILEPLLRDIVESALAGEPRPYQEFMDAWRTSCPRLTVWEEAIDRGLLVRGFTPQRGAVVIVTDAGRRFVGREAKAAREAAE